MRIESVKHLEKLFEGREQLDCFLALGNSIRSSKVLFSYPEGCTVVHEIDDTEDEYASWAEMLEKSEVKKWIEEGRFHVYDYDVE